MTWLVRYLPALLGLLAAAALGGFLTHRFYDAPAYARLESDFAVFRAQAATDREIAADTAAKALIAQAERHQVDAAHNAQVVNELQQSNTAAAARHAADLVFIHGLLGNCPAAAPAPGGDSVPAPGDLRGAPGAGGTGGAQAVAELCTDTKAEDERNANRLDALIAEILPKLKRAAP